MVGARSLYLAKPAVLLNRQEQSGGVADEADRPRSYEPPTLLTIGYEGRSVPELIEVLQRASVTMVVDIRLTPVSRKQGFSKHKLNNELSRAGIDYLHIPVLGNPRDNRDTFRRGDPRSRRRFRAVMRQPQAQEVLADLLSRVYAGRLVLLCYERDAKTCHRTLVAEEIFRGAPVLVIEDL